MLGSSLALGISPLSKAFNAARLVLHGHFTSETKLLLVSFLLQRVSVRLEAMNGQIWLCLKQIELETLNLCTNSSQDSILKREPLEQQPDQEKESHQISARYSWKIEVSHLQRTPRGWICIQPFPIYSPENP